MYYRTIALGVYLCAGVAFAASGVQSPEGATVVSVQQLQHPLSKRGRDLLNQAMRAYFRRQFDVALGILRKAVGVDPESWEVNNNLGVVYSSLGRDRDAQEAFQTAINLGGDSEVSYTNLAAVSFNLGDYRVAETAARGALRVSPEAPQAEVMLGLAQVAEGHWSAEAKKHLEKSRSDYAQAQVVLAHWPTERQVAEGKAPVVQGPGPGSFAGVTADRPKNQTETVAFSK